MNAFDIVILGGGAAGLCSAIFAAETAPGARVAIVNSARSLGAKILVSGGGRCNVTHERVTPSDFSGPRTIVRNVLAAFDEKATVRWFDSLGVPLKREPTGKLFPVSDSARTVLAALLRRCAELRIEILAGHRARDVTISAGMFHVHHEGGEIQARRLIFATGGRSLPKTGSDGEGWNIVQRLGHTVTDTWPALVPLVLDDRMFHAKLAGLSHEAQISTYVSGKRMDQRAGSMLWTHFGISGPVVMDASRHWTIAHGRGQPVEMHCSFRPGTTADQADRHLLASIADRPKAGIATVVSQWVPQRLAEALAEYAGIAPQTPAGQLPRKARRQLIRALTEFALPVVRDRGWNYAEVTAGGVPLNEIDFRTMQSRRVPGLYLVGEMLDCDGRIGGFNFQWAWATGHIAGKAAAKSLG